MSEIDMGAKPFFLDGEAQRWVLDILNSMSLEQKCGQVFCPMGFSSDTETLRHLTKEIGVGGLMYRADAAERIQKTHRKLQELSEIP